jgi:AbrB family looped-hinge helix DNA binding protein
MGEQTVISSKGQVVIPKSVRDAFGWEPGTLLNVDADEFGVTLRPVPTKRARAAEIAKGVQKLSGLLHSPSSARISDDDMARIVRDRAAARNGIGSHS